jgi:hypothetical protein
MLPREQIIRADAEKIDDRRLQRTQIPGPDSLRASPEFPCGRQKDVLLCRSKPWTRVVALKKQETLGQIP